MRPLVGMGEVVVTLMVAHRFVVNFTYERLLFTDRTPDGHTLYLI